MPARDDYAEGVFCWTDLQSPDPQAAAAFYTAVLGWAWEESPLPGGQMSYFNATVDGRRVAGMGPLMDEARAQGVPPSWSSYVAVDDAAATCARAEELGATVVVPAMRIMDEGHMAMLADPTGAVIGLWQALEHRGAQTVNEPGALCWNELHTPDVATADAFYGELLGWRTEDASDGGEEYRMIRAEGAGDGGANGGLSAMLAPGTPPHWLTYFAVDDADLAVAVVEREGGAVHVGPFDLPIGRIAVAADPHGAAFALIALTPA